MNSSEVLLSWDDIFMENCGDERLVVLSVCTSVFVVPLSLLFFAATVAFFRRRKIFHPLFSFCFLVLFLFYFMSTSVLAVRNITFSIYRQNFDELSSTTDRIIAYCEKIYIALIYFIPPMITIGIFERLSATVFSRFYEKSRPWTVLALALLAMSALVYIEFANRHVMQATIPTRNVQVVFALVCTGSLFVLLIANRSKSKTGRARSALSERYQVTENIKALRILIPVVCLDTLIQIGFLGADIFLNVGQVLNLNYCYDDDVYLDKFLAFRLKPYELCPCIAQAKREHVFQLGFAMQYSIPLTVIFHFSLLSFRRRGVVRRATPVSPSQENPPFYVVTIRNVFGTTVSGAYNGTHGQDTHFRTLEMSCIDELSSDLQSLAMERHENGDSVHQERGRMTRKSSTSSNGSSSLEKRKLFHRKDSEVKIEAIFKELFSPDAKIIDHYEGDFVIPDVQIEEIEPDQIPNHERFKLRRQTSLVPKSEAPKKTSISPLSPRHRLTARKSPVPLRKVSTPTPRKRSTSSKAPLPKLSAPPGLKPNFVTVADDGPSSTPWIRKNPIPLRRGVAVSAMAQK
ncbi:unnamed protein product [Caenorhabditis sp. 36 PRJEB53466]|nr:unnamed protein product [Caenorhabditis sp. 36 PRJEB53466]